MSKNKTTKEKINYQTTELIRDLWRFIKPYRWKFWLGTFFKLTADIVWLYPAYALAEIVTTFTNYTTEEALKKFWTIMIIWILIAIYHHIAKDLGRFLIYQTAEKVSIDQSLRTIKHLFNLDLAWHERENSGNKIKKIEKGSSGIDAIIRMWGDNAIDVSVNFIGMTYIISVFDQTIAAVLLFFIPTFFLLSYFLTKRAKVAVNEENIVDEEISGLAFESINNIRSVKVLSMKANLTKIITDKFAVLFDKISYRIKCFRARQAILNIYGQTFRLSILVFIVLGISRGSYEIGFLVLYYSYFNKIWKSIDDISHITNYFIISKYGIWRMKLLLNEKVKIDKTKGKQPFPKDWQKISLQNISFAYDKQAALKNISFDIKRGERIGVVGLSGAGKSTLFKLLLKEREDYKGKILFDDVLLKNIGKEEYLRHAATVLQETELFNFSLRRNIDIVTSERNDEMLHKALKIAHVADFLDKLPQGVDTLIGEKGVKLSGGEKQRVGIARAVYKQPDVFFLDEATSHLDVESEMKIRDSLHQFFQNVTAIVIAHRLSTIREMDRILVFEQGEIIESGNFGELIKKKGRFFEMWKKQGF